MGVIALLPSNAQVLSSIGGWVGDLFARDRERPYEERQVARYMREVRHELAWQGPLRFYTPSLIHFRRHFDWLDPRRIHRLSQRGIRSSTNVRELARRAPRLMGQRIVVHARVEWGRQVATYGRVSSWSYVLYDRARERTRVICRVPQPTVPEPALRSGMRVSATGVLIASGTIEATDGKPQRISYLACSAIGPRLRSTLRAPDGSGRSVVRPVVLDVD